MNGRDFSDKVCREQFWREHVSRWETSGQTIVGYCLQHGINEKTFHNWKSKFIRRGTQASQPEATHTFVEVQMPFRAEASVEVSYPSDERRIYTRQVLSRGGCSEMYRRGWIWVFGAMVLVGVAGWAGCRVSSYRGAVAGCLCWGAWGCA